MFLKTIRLRKLPAVENDLIQAVEHSAEDDQLRALQRGYSGSNNIFDHCATINDLESTLLNRLKHLDGQKTIVL